MTFLDQVKELGHEKERAALALLSLSFFGVVYLLVGMGSPPGWGPAFLALSGCYLIAFLALASEWFWSRWFASGLGWSGAMVGLVGLVSVGWHPILAVYAGLHALIVVTLLGPKMAARYDLQPAWQKRFGMDEFGVARLRKAVTRASASLPSLIVWALGPREGDGQLELVNLLVAALALWGVFGLVRLRTWGVLALAGAGVALPWAGNGDAMLRPFGWLAPYGLVSSSALVGLVTALVLAVAVWPFVGPIAHFLKPRR